MRTRRLGCMAVLAVGLVVGWVGSGAAARPSDAEYCEAAKLRAAGEKAQCLATETANEVLGQTPKFAECDSDASRRPSRRPKARVPGVCPTEGDTAAVEAQVDTCVADIAAALSGTPPPPACGSFPATGQTTCFDGSNVATDCLNTSGRTGISELARR